MALITSGGSHEGVTIHRDPDCRDIEGSRKRITDGRFAQEPRHERHNFAKLQALSIAIR